MRVSAQKYLRAIGAIPAARYLRDVPFGTSMTQERRRPARTGAVAAQKPNPNRPNCVSSRPCCGR